MKHLILIVTLAIAGISFATPETVAKAAPKVVYVCISPTSSRYHASESCSGLNRCTHEIRAVSVTDAEKMGKTSCHICKP